MAPVDSVAQMEHFLNELKIELISAQDKLILEDAAKYRFSINTGKRLMIAEMEQKIAQIKRERNS